MKELTKMHLDAVTENEAINIISKEEYRLMMQKSLYQCARFMTLNPRCWHMLLEKECRRPQTLVRNDSSSEELIDCDRKCPRCDGSMKLMIQLVLRNGLTMLLVKAFGDKCNGKVAPMQFSKQLFEFENVGQIVYNRTLSKKATSLQVTEMTVFQLITANIIRIEVNTTDKKPIVHCDLCFDKETHDHSNAHIQPHYSIDKHWDDVITF